MDGWADRSMRRKSAKSIKKGMALRCMETFASSSRFIGSWGGTAACLYTDRQAKRADETLIFH